MIKSKSMLMLFQARFWILVRVHLRGIKTFYFSRYIKMDVEKKKGVDVVGK